MPSFPIHGAARENLFADPSEKIAEFSEAVRAKRKAPDRLDFPFAAQDIDGGLNGTAVMNFHRWEAPGLQICAYFTAVQGRLYMSRKHSTRTSQPDSAGCREPHKMEQRK